ncbi:hypothetical protein BCR44DRAFT_1202080 [Catenaria anguillulae PL171]|uniref:Uncharacterized protein n=1 Tax=Catenaria anguillulae PL171 TaxID=765915 RepID=A0A1Y2HFL4_9FUNG|nr:hypothetical protein BCR44DRAFT_1202080 [Catenaria anguillulae PL171]
MYTTSFRRPIQHFRVQESLKRVNPVAGLKRWKAKITRRKYKVKGSMSLWYNDGWHKLIRCAAGGSLFCMALLMAAATSSLGFERTPTTHPIPFSPYLRILSSDTESRDRGTENTLVRAVMIRCRGAGKRS